MSGQIVGRKWNSLQFPLPTLPFVYPSFECVMPTRLTTLSEKQGSSTLQFCCCEKKESRKRVRFHVFACGSSERSRCSLVSESVQITMSRYCDPRHLRSFHEPPSVSLLAADCEEKPQGPPVNGRKGKWSEQCDRVTLPCFSGQHRLQSHFHSSDFFFSPIFSSISSNQFPFDSI